MTMISRRSIIIGSASAGLLPKFARSDDNPPTPPAPPAAEAPKPKQLSAAQQLEHTAVLLRTKDAQGREYSGTGFFFNFFRNGDQGVTGIVTNRHVVAGMTKIAMKWTRRTPANEPDFGKVVDVTIDVLSDPRIILHPDPEIDLAVILVSELINKYQSESKPIYAVGADEALIASSADLRKFQPLEDVLIVGFPDGISDTANNIPIFRRGVTATPVYMKFNGKKQFMIDAAIYHGSSGSPVFLYNVGAWINEDGQPQLGYRVGLLGVVWGVFETSTEGELRVIPAPTQLTTKVYSNIPHNLGACVPSYCILDFEPEMVRLGYKPPEGYKMRAQP
ncbi:S1 family peptidase [Bradyrhizobium sp. AZCC 2230]|uniref:S1 family peptidase n=1 Tax=Bradyrhizobium sp. AZCC 2230 TaxID=3117021 RepID=UPI002FF1E3A4